MRNRLRFVSSILAIASLLLIGGATSAAASGAAAVEPATVTEPQVCDGAGCFSLVIGQVEGQQQYYAIGAYLGRDAGTITVKLEYQNMVISRTISCVTDGRCAAMTPLVTKPTDGAHQLCATVEFADSTGANRLGPYQACRAI